MSVASKELYMVGEGGRELLGVVEGESEGVDKLFNQAYPLSSRGVWKKKILFEKSNILSEKVWKEIHRGGG